MRSQYKATKIQKGSKTFVVVTDAEGNEIARMGGKRAERAQAVVLTVDEYWYHDEFLETKIDAGCRQEMEAAETEARSPRRASKRLFMDYYHKDWEDGKWVPAQINRESHAIRID